jgi:hypothetical protein
MRSTCRFQRGIAALIASSALAGSNASCASPGKDVTPTVIDVSEASGASREAEAIRATVVGETMFYTVRWGRAEDIAETLYPLLESLYGPGVRVTPHIPTNKLMIHIPRGDARSRSPSPANRTQ